MDLNMEKTTGVAAERVKAYRAIRSSDEYYDYFPSPAYSLEESRTKPAKESEWRPWLNDLSFLTAIIAGFALLMGVISLGGQVFGIDAVDQEWSAVWAFFIASAGLGILPIWNSIDLARREAKRDHREPTMLISNWAGAAWTDWTETVEEVRSMDEHSDAYRILVEQDPIVRRALTAYATDKEIPAEQRREFEDWLFSICAAAKELSVTEKERVEAYKSYYRNPTITMALESPTLIPTATQNSRILTRHVREVLEPKES